MKRENEDKEILLPVTNYKTIENIDTVAYNHEPFDIEGSFTDARERPLPIPIFISNQQTFYEKSKCLRLLCCCYTKKYSRSSISNIKNKELKVYYKLKALASQLFDENNTQHKESLKFLAMLCINKEMAEDFKMTEWKRIGFQVTPFCLIFLDR